MYPVRFTDVAGRKKTVDFRCNQGRININNLSISEIDWTSVAKFQKLEILEIHQNRGAETIDLHGIEQCRSLKELHITKGEFTHLDISPLSVIPQIRKLILEQNRLSHFDIDPLKECLNLEELDLNGNRIDSLDLGSLSRLNRLKLLSIINPIKKLDLTPLSSLSNLTTFSCSVLDQEHLNIEPLSNCPITDLTLRVSHPENLDLKPLINHRRIFDFKVELSDFVSTGYHYLDMTPLVFNRIDRFIIDPKLISTVAYTHRLSLSFFINNRFYKQLGMDHFITKWGWARMRDILVEHELVVVEKEGDGSFRFSLQEEVLKGFELGWLAGVDADILGILLDTPDTATYEDIQKHVTGICSEVLAKQLERAGSTHFLDVDEMSKYPEYIRLIPLLLERRNIEMEQIAIYVDSRGFYDLEQVWLTSYGYSLLSSVELKPSRKDLYTKDIEQVQKIFSDFKIPITAERVETHPVKMSEGMKSFIVFKAKENLADKE